MLDLLDRDVVIAPDAISASRSLLSRARKSSVGCWLASMSWLGPAADPWYEIAEGGEPRCWLSKLDWVGIRSIWLLLY